MTLRLLIVIGLLAVSTKSQSQRNQNVDQYLQDETDNGENNNVVSEMNGRPAGGFQFYQFPNGMNSFPSGDNGMDFRPGGMQSRLSGFPMQRGPFSFGSGNFPPGQGPQDGWMNFPGGDQNMPFFGANGMQSGIGRPGFQSLNTPGQMSVTFPQFRRQGSMNNPGDQGQSLFFNQPGQQGFPAGSNFPNIPFGFQPNSPSFPSDPSGFSNFGQSGQRFDPSGQNFGPGGQNFGLGGQGFGSNTFGQFGPNSGQSHFNMFGPQGSSFNRNLPGDGSNSDFMGGMRQFRLDKEDNEGNTNPYIPGLGFVNDRNVGPRNPFSNQGSQFGQNSDYDNSLGMGAQSCVNKDGMYGDTQKECTVYYMCQRDGRRDTYSCPTTTKFNNKLQVCDYATNVDAQCNPINGSGDQARQQSKNHFSNRLPHSESGRQQSDYYDQ